MELSRAYKILDLPLNSPLPSIKRKYKKLALLLHPDRQGDRQGQAFTTTTFTDLQSAYEVLTFSGGELLVDDQTTTKPSDSPSLSLKVSEGWAEGCPVP